jgi:hypothetical protein
MRFGLVIAFIEILQSLITSNYNFLIKLLTIAHANLYSFTSRCLVMDSNHSRPSIYMCQKSQRYNTSDGQSVLTSSPILGSNPDFCRCKAVGGFFDVGPLSNKTMELFYNSSAAILGSECTGLMTIFNCLKFENLPIPKAWSA